MHNTMFSLSKDADITDLCAEGLRHLPTKDFCYLQMSADGKLFELSNDMPSQDFYFQHTDNQLWVSSISNYCSGPTSGMVLTGTCPQTDFMRDYREQFRFYYGINFYTRKDDKVEIFQFSSSVKNPTILNHYLNHQDQYHQFIAYFLDAAQPIIQQGEKNGIQLINYPKLITDQPTIKKQLIHLAENHPLRRRFSKRELQILHLNATLKTSREIADILCLSTRTIEGYILRLKKQLGCHHKNQLATAALDMGLGQALS